MLSLKNTSLVAFAAVVALPLIVFWAWPYSTAMDERLADAGERDLLIARSLSASLEFYHDELTAILDDAVSDSDSPASFGDAQLASEAGFDYIAWVDETGRVLRKLGDHADLVPPVYDTVRLSALRAELKLGTPLGRVRASVSSRPELFFVRSRNNRLIVASVSTEHITNLAQRVNANREIVVSIVDAAGRVIASPLRHWELQAKDLSSLPVVRGLSMGIQGVSEADLAELGSSMIAAAVPVNGAGWGVIVSEPSAEVGVGDTQTSFAIAILVILVAALVGSLIAAPIVGPLMALSRAAQRMQKGETEVRIESLSWFAPTELIELRQAFNGMAESVAKARAEEAVARDTSDRANRSKTEFLRNVEWGELDYLVLDLPPGTGDVPLTLAQNVRAAGVVLVSTPQDVALADVIRAKLMFDKVNIPVLGIVENMSAFVCPHCRTETAIFDKGGARAAATKMGIKFLGEVPIDLAIREGGDKGVPVVAGHPDSPQAGAFLDVARNVGGAVSMAVVKAPKLPVIGAPR